MSPRPPRFARLLIRLIARPEDRPAVLHDLHEEFFAMMAEGASESQARSWYRRQALGSAIPLLRTRLRNAVTDLSSIGASGLDLRLGLRMLVKHPGLTLVAIFALAVGIPVGLAPMHAAALFEADLPVPEGDRIHIVRDHNPRTRRWERSSIADYRALQDEMRSFQSMGAFIRTAFNVGVDDDREPALEGGILTASSFEILKTGAAMGRVFSTEDEAIGGPDVVLLGHTFWQTRFGGTPDVVGRTVQVSGVPHTVIGVMPEGFKFPYLANLWLPLRTGAAREDDARQVTVFGRLADDVSPDAAQVELSGIAARLTAEHPERREGLQAWVSPFSLGMFGTSNRGLRGEVGFYFVQLLALFVLVVACLNIGMLILVRTTARAGELAVRTALGASRGRVVSQLFVEALLLGVIAAGVGLVIADQAAARLTFLSTLLPYWMDLGVTPRTAIWAMSLAGLSAAVVGVIPALKVTGRNVHQSMQQASANRSGIRFGGISSALIVADVAVAVVAVGVAFAFTEAMTKVTGEGGTVRAEEYLYAELTITNGRSASLGDGLDADQRGVREGEAKRLLLDRLQSEPGVRSVALGDAMPGTEVERRLIEIEGEATQADGENDQWGAVTHVVPGFFAAMDQPLLAGRRFREGDGESDVGTAIVNSEFAKDFLGGRSAMGRRIRAVNRDGTPDSPWLEVVGVVPYVASSTAVTSGSPGVYIATPAEGIGRARLAIRIGDEPAAFLPRLRELTQEVDAEAVIGNAMPLSDVVSFDAFVIRWAGLGVKVLIGIMIALAASGIYALLAFTVAARTQEIAIRTALGSPRSRILMSIAKRALIQLGLGVTLGMALTAPMLTLVAGSGWSPVFPPILLTAVAGLGVLVTIAGLACIGPARQGLSIAPSQALKS